MTGYLLRIYWVALSIKNGMGGAFSFDKRTYQKDTCWLNKLIIIILVIFMLFQLKSVIFCVYPLRSTSPAEPNVTWWSPDIAICTHYVSVKNYPCSVSRSSLGREILGAFPPRGARLEKTLNGCKFVLKRTVYNR